MELRALIEAVKLAGGPAMIISDHEGIVGLARDGRTPRMCKPLWDELYAAAAGKDIEFAWKKRDQSLGSRLAHQLARDAVRGVSQNRVGTRVANAFSTGTFGPRPFLCRTARNHSGRPN